MPTPQLGLGAAFGQFIDSERQSRDLRDAAHGAAQMFAQIGTPEAKQYADLFVQNPSAAFAIGKQVGGLQNLLALAQAQAARSKLATSRAGLAPGSPEDIRAIGNSAVDAGEYGAYAQIEQLARPEPEKDPITREFKTTDANGNEKIVTKQFDRATRQWQEVATGSRFDPNSGVTVNTGEQPLTSVVGLQNAFVKQSALFTGIARGLDVAREMKLQGNVQADLDLISSVAKAIDPESVVRGSEVEMRIDYRNISSKLGSFLQKITGGGILTPSDREEIIGALEGELRARSKLQRGVEKQFGSIADQYKVPRHLIITDSVDDVLGRAFASGDGKSFAPGENGLPR